MAAHRTITLANGHTLTLVQTDSSIFAVQERNELGTFIATAYTTRDRAEGLRWLARAEARGFGLRPTLPPASTQEAVELAAGSDFSPPPATTESAIERAARREIEEGFPSKPITGTIRRGDGGSAIRRAIERSSS